MKTHIDETTQLEVPFTPQGRFLHVEPEEPSTEWQDFALPWWADPKYVVGRLTKTVRKIKFMNTLSKSQDIIEVCTEETLAEIQERLIKQVNKHSTGYIWRFGGKQLNMQKTLDINGIVDRSKEMRDAAMNEDEWIPVIHLQFADDLTIA